MFERVMNFHERLLPFLALLPLAGCVAHSTTDAALDTGAVVPLTPTVAQPVPMQSMPLPLPIVALRGDGARLWIVTAAGVQTLTADLLEPANLLPVAAMTDAGPVAQLPAVTAVGTRAGGIIVATANGLFADQGGMLVRAPLSDALAGMSVRAISAVGWGSGEQVWLLTDTGVLRANNGQLDRLTLPDSFGAVTALAATADGNGSPSGALLAVTGQGLCQCDDDLNLACSAAHQVALATAGTRTAALIDGDVAILDASGWQRWHPESAATAIFGQPDGSVLARFGKQIQRLDDATWHALADLPADVTDAVMAQALDGATFVASGGKLLRFATGHPVHFAELVPQLQTACASCHASGVGAPKHDFTDLATVRALGDAILARVSTGQMPPAPAVAWTADQVTRFARWRNAGYPQ